MKLLQQAALLAHALDSDPQTDRMGHAMQDVRHERTAVAERIELNLGSTKKVSVDARTRKVAHQAHQTTPMDGGTPWDTYSPTLTISVEDTEEDYSRLIGQEVQIPWELRKTFRKENPWEEIQNLKYKDHGGEKVHESINYLAERRSRDGLQTSNKDMWEAMFGNGRKRLSSKQIVRAAFNIQIGDARYDNPTEWLVASYESATGPKKEEYRNVLKSVDTILNYLPQLKDVGVTAQSYYEQQPDRVPEGMEAAADFTAQNLFDPNEEMPYVRVGFIRRFGLAVNGDKLPRIGNENWTDNAAKSGIPSTAEAEISEAAAFDALMSTGDEEAYVEEVNRLMDLGAVHVTGLENRETQLEPITVEDVQARRPLNQDQKKAVQYGMSMDASAQFELYQSSSSSLDEADREARKRRAAVGSVYGSGFAGAAIDVPSGDNIGVGGGVAGNLNLGSHLAADVGITGSLVDNGEELVGDTDLRTGLKWRSGRFGKNKKLQAEAGAHLSFDLSDGRVGVDGNAAIKSDIGEKGIWALKLGARAEIGTDHKGASGEVELGIERDFDRQFEVFLERYEEENAEEINAYKKRAYTAIDDSHYDETRKAAFKKAAEDAIDRHVREQAFKKWTRCFRQFKVAGFGIQAGADLNLEKLLRNGLRIGPFVNIAFGFDHDRVYEETPSMVGGGATREIAGFKLIDSKSAAIELPESEFYIGDEAERAEAVERVRVQIENAREARNQALKDSMRFSREGGIPYERVDFRGLKGHVRLYGQGMELITNKTANYLNLSLESHLSVFIDETISSTGENETIIYVSSLPGATRESIRATGETHLAWFQYANGQITNSRIVNQTDRSHFYTLEEAREKGLASKELDPESYVYELSYEVNKYTARDFELARIVGKELTRLVDYEDFALAGKDAEIDRLITSLYRANGVPAAEVNEDRKNMARMVATVEERPVNFTVPMAWNKKATHRLNPEASKLLMAYLTAHKDEMEAGRMTSHLPRHTAVAIAVSHEGMDPGEAYLVTDYHPELNERGVVGLVEWDDGSPEAEAATLRMLGQAVNDENRATIRSMVETIRNYPWPESPYYKLQAPTLRSAKQTIAGEYLLEHAIEIYGPEKGNQLRAMSNGTLAVDAFLEAEFVEDVQELLDHHRTMAGGSPVFLEETVYTGFWGDCYNPFIAKGLEGSHRTPEKQGPEIRLERQRRELGMDQYLVMTHHQVEAIIGIPRYRKEEGGGEKTDDATGGSSLPSSGSDKPADDPHDEDAPEEISN